MDVILAHLGNGTVRKKESRDGSWRYNYRLAIAERLGVVVGVGFGGFSMGTFGVG